MVDFLLFWQRDTTYDFCFTPTPRSIGKGVYSRKKEFTPQEQSLPFKKKSVLTREIASFSSVPIPLKTLLIVSHREIYVKFICSVLIRVCNTCLLPSYVSTVDLCYQDAHVLPKIKTTPVLRTLYARSKSCFPSFFTPSVFPINDHLWNCPKMVFKLNTNWRPLRIRKNYRN